MRKEYKFDKGNVDKQLEEWEMVCEVVAGARYFETIGTDLEHTAEWWQNQIDISIHDGFIEVTATMDDDLDSEDDYVEWDLKPTLKTRSLVKLGKFLFNWNMPSPAPKVREHDDNRNENAPESPLAEDIKEITDNTTPAAEKGEVKVNESGQSHGSK